jgi:hypothetical protein
VGLGRNPEASPQTLVLLSHDPVPEVQVALAWNPRTRGSALARLSHSTPEVQTGVAQNPRSPADVLARLAGSPDAFIRSAAAVNPRLPVLLLERLAGDADPQVRRHVARNRRVPYHLLARLTQDPTPTRDVPLKLAPNSGTAEASPPADRYSFIRLNTRSGTSLSAKAIGRQNQGT